jgi:hypothetical protein
VQTAHTIAYWVAFLIAEAISILKKLVLETCRKRGIDTALPKNPKLSKSEIYDRGATIDPKLAKKEKRFRCMSCVRLGAIAHRPRSVLLQYGYTLLDAASFQGFISLVCFL